MLPEPRAGRRPRAGGGRDAGTDETARDWHRAESEPQGWERPGLRRQRGATEKSNKAAEPFTDPALQPTPTPMRAVAGTAWDLSLLAWAGLGWQAGWHRLQQRQMVRRGPDPRPTGEWLGLSVLGSPPTAPPPAQTSRPWDHGWGNREKRSNLSARPASPPPASRFGFLSLPMAHTACSQPGSGKDPDAVECDVSVREGQTARPHPRGE